MLGRKQSVRNNEDWKNALDHIEETVPKKELDSLVKKTVKDIKEKCKGKKAAYQYQKKRRTIIQRTVRESRTLRIIRQQEDRVPLKQNRK